MTTNELWTLGIAIYAAVVATMVLGWDVLKWKLAGPKLLVTCQPGMLQVGRGAGAAQKLVLVTVVNRGDQPTTLTNLGGMCYAKSWHRWGRRFRFWTKQFPPLKTFIVTEPSQAQRLPHPFSPGEQWMGLMEQDTDIEEMMDRHSLFIVVYHAHSDSGVWVRARKR